ncbi:MAG: hypothetical protein WC483_00390 [Candidatus Paceibacterota bacterium]
MTTATVAVAPAVVAPAVVAAPTKPKRIGSKLLVLPKREAFVSWILGGGKYGHHSLFPIRFTEHSVTHDALTKLIAELAKKGKPTLVSGKLNFVDSMCYFVPLALRPREEKTGGGDSGVKMFKFGTINARPGSFILLAAAEAILCYFTQCLIDAMKLRVDPTKGAHMLDCEDIANFLATTQDPVLCHLNLFYKRWRTDVPYSDMIVEEKEKKVPEGAAAAVKPTKPKTIHKRIYHALTFDVPNAKHRMGDDERYIVDQILETRAGAMKKRGAALYATTLAKYKAGPAAAKKVVAPAAVDPAAVAPKKKRDAPIRSDLAIAVDADRKKQKEAGIEAKHYVPTEEGYDPTPLLSQKKFAKAVIASIPDARLYIGKIKPEVGRFFDDAFNEILFSMVNLSISKMVLLESLKMTPSIANCAVKDFFDTLCGSKPNDARNLAIQRALIMEKDYESIMSSRRARVEEARKRRGETASMVGEDEEEEEPEDEEEDGGEEPAAAVVTAPAPAPAPAAK